MKIKTKVDVSCPISGKVQLYNGKLIGELKTVIMYPEVIASWEYQKEDESPILSGTSKLTEEKVDQLLVSPITDMESSRNIFYSALRYEMAETFGIDINDIEFI